MTSGGIRRAQLIQPFGVGAMSILVDGTSVIVCGLDHWFKSSGGETISVGEFENPVDDWRLQERLGVASLRMPPDFRTASRDGDRVNSGLTIPVLRFPRWSFCPHCKTMKYFPLSLSERPRCADALHSTWKVKPHLVQVPFVAICERGHLSDFPFPAWVHKSVNGACRGELKLKSFGGGGLQGQRVICSCGSSRSLEGVLNATFVDEERSSVLTESLEPGTRFGCVGERPWLSDPGQGCGEPLRGALRGAGNVYFPKVESSIYLPASTGNVRAEVLECLRLPEVSVALRMLISFDRLSVAELRRSVSHETLSEYKDEELSAALQEYQRQSPGTSESGINEEALSDVLSWRQPEFDAFLSLSRHPDLLVRDPGLADGMSDFLEFVRRIDVLRETRVLRGFTRLGDSALTLSSGKAQLRTIPMAAEHDWLPAYVVRGEGIFLSLNNARVEAWENKDSVRRRIDRLAGSFEAAAERRGLQRRSITPRFVLLHTLAHLMINQLVFTSGYGSAALRERIYFDESDGSQLNGFLIYTAAGDADGTMGGLVRMADPRNLESLMIRAVEDARWCSSDPVCMELGEAGQGPDSCNLAACHGCGLLPETSCEEFNRFLDRAMIVGTHDDPSIGFFNNPDSS